MHESTHTRTCTWYSDSYLQPEGVTQSQRSPPHRNSRHGSPRLLITALDLSRWRTILFRHCMGNLASIPQLHLTFAFVSFLLSSNLSISLHVKSPRRIYVASLFIFGCGKLFLRDFYTLISFNYVRFFVCVCVCVCSCVCHIKWTSVCDWPCEVMCDTGNCRQWWDFFLVSGRANKPFS